MAGNTGKIKIIGIKDSIHYTPDKESLILPEEISGGVFNIPPVSDSILIDPDSIKWEVNGEIKSTSQNNLRINMIISMIKNMINYFPKITDINGYYVEDITTIDLNDFFTPEGTYALIIYDVNRIEFLDYETMITKSPYNNINYENLYGNEKIIAVITR